MNPAIQAILIGLPATALGILAYFRSKKVDRVAEQSGLITQTRAGTEQIIEGLNHLIDNLQVDNKVFREEVRYLTDRFDRVMAERDKLRAEVVRLRTKYPE